MQIQEDSSTFGRKARSTWVGAEEPATGHFCSSSLADFGLRSKIKLLQLGQLAWVGSAGAAACGCARPAVG